MEQFANHVGVYLCQKGICKPEDLDVLVFGIDLILFRTQAREFTHSADNQRGKSHAAAKAYSRMQVLRLFYLACGCIAFQR